MGVGGIEAEAAMLGQPVSMLIPDVVGFKVTGKLREGITATASFSLLPKCCANMAWWGNSSNFMVMVSIHYRWRMAPPLNMSPGIWCRLSLLPNRCCNPRLHALSGRSEDQVELVEKYAKAQGMWRNPGDEPIFTSTLELDMNDVEASLAGPKRPQDALHCPMYQKHLPPVTNWK